jgi:hypothetical protein
MTGLREETNWTGLLVKPAGFRRLGICRHGFEVEIGPV